MESNKCTPGKCKDVVKSDQARIYCVEEHRCFPWQTFTCRKYDKQGDKKFYNCDCEG